MKASLQLVATICFAINLLMYAPLYMGELFLRRFMKKLENQHHSGSIKNFTVSSNLISIDLIQQNSTMSAICHYG
jgi:hypothetical protein